MMIGGSVRMRRRCKRCDCQSNKDGQRWRNSVSGKSPLRTVDRQRERLTNCDPEFFCIVKEGGSRMLVDDLYLFTRSSVVDTVNKGGLSRSRMGWSSTISPRASGSRVRKSSRTPPDSRLGWAGLPFENKQNIGNDQRTSASVQCPFDVKLLDPFVQFDRSSKGPLISLHCTCPSFLFL